MTNVIFWHSYNFYPIFTHSNTFSGNVNLETTILIDTFKGFFDTDGNMETTHMFSLVTSVAPLWLGPRGNYENLRRSFARNSSCSQIC